MPEIVPGIHQLRVPIPDNPLGFLNSYLVRGRDGWLMVDTGWNEEASFQSLKDQLGGLGIGFGDITRIIVTHIHADHYGLAGRIKEHSPANLLMHEAERPFIQSRYVNYEGLMARMGVIFHRHGVPDSELPRLQGASLPVLGFVEPTWPEILLKGGETISTGFFDLEVIWTPGHSSGHVCLYETKARILFSGDHILPVITPNISYHAESTANPLGDYVRALHRIESLPVDLVLPAHEQVFTGLKERIKAILDHHASRKQAILDTIRDEPRTAYDISGRIPWETMGVPWEKLSAFTKRAAVTETLAHLLDMEEEGMVRTVQANTVARWERVSAR